jgi:hypothetical protein
VSTTIPGFQVVVEFGSRRPCGMRLHGPPSQLGPPLLLPELEPDPESDPEPEPEPELDPDPEPDPDPEDPEPELDPPSGLSVDPESPFDPQAAAITVGTRIGNEKRTGVLLMSIPIDVHSMATCGR